MTVEWYAALSRSRTNTPWFHLEWEHRQLQIQLTYDGAPRQHFPLYYLNHITRNIPNMPKSETRESILGGNQSARK